MLADAGSIPAVSTTLAPYVIDRGALFENTSYTHRKFHRKTMAAGKCTFTAPRSDMGSRRTHATITAVDVILLVARVPASVKIHLSANWSGTSRDASNPLAYC